MNEQIKKPLEPNPIRSFGAVLAGFISTAIVTAFADNIMHSTGVYPPFGEVMSDKLFMLALSYRIVLNTVGCMIAAKLAPYYPTRHALALGIFGTIAASIGAYAMWDKGPEWYSIANIIIAIPCGLLGGKLYEIQLKRKKQV